MLFHAQAFVPTLKPSVYAGAVAKDLGLEFETEWSAEAGYIKLPDGVCDMHAWPEGLRLDVFAEAHDGLMRVEELVKRHLERRRGSNEPIVVEWRLRPTFSRS
jgi:hypothetical protein